VPVLRDVMVVFGYQLRLVLRNPVWGLALAAHLFHRESA
jgi:hypothetical protein